jgi:hypothetical protein
LKSTFCNRIRDIMCDLKLEADAIHACPQFVQRNRIRKAESPDNVSCFHWL